MDGVLAFKIVLTATGGVLRLLDLLCESVDLGVEFVFHGVESVLQSVVSVVGFQSLDGSLEVVDGLIQTSLVLFGEVVLLYGLAKFSKAVLVLLNQMFHLFCFNLLIIKNIWI